MSFSLYGFLLLDMLVRPFFLSPLPSAFDVCRSGNSPCVVSRKLAILIKGTREAIVLLLTTFV